MTIVYRPPTHHCDPPRQSMDVARRQPRGTIWRCDECGDYRVSDGNARWVVPFPFGPTARRIKRIEKAASDNPYSPEQGAGR